MKVGGKRKATSEVENDASAVDFGTYVTDGSGGHVDGDGVGHKDASFAEEENTQLQKGEAEEPHEEDSEEEAADEEGEEEHEGEVALPVLGPCPMLSEGYYEVEAIRRKRIRKVKFLFFLFFYDWVIFLLSFLGPVCFETPFPVFTF